MIKSLKLKNFRNFKNNTFIFENEKFFIIWKNWKWKTNILEALSILNNNSIIWLSFDNLVKKNENNFFIEQEDDKWNTFGISYDKALNKKKYFINKKVTSKKNYNNNTNLSVIFSPIIMNIMYLSPGLRRNFLDQILINSYSNYDKLLRTYKKILTNRNKVLKNIRENKSQKSEIIFWNQEFIKISISIYKIRFELNNFFEKHIKKSSEYFFWKIKNIDFVYLTKINKNNIENDILNYLNKNLDRDIILWKTNIWPHIDDFEIIIDNNKLIDYASRWETKSIIIWLKLLETAFIENKTNKKPVLFIDDLLSELDEMHKNLLLDKIKYYQTFITSINKINNTNYFLEL